MSVIRGNDLLGWLFTLLFVLTPVTPLHANREEARAALARGLTALDRGDARTARVELMNANRADANWPDARIAQARAALALKDGQEAEAAINRARTLGASIGATRMVMAEALLLQGRADQALQESTAGDAPATDAALAARLSGDAMVSLGNMAGARIAYDRLLDLAPDDPRAWISVGRFRLASGDVAAANQAGARAAELGPRNVDALVFRGALIRDQFGLVGALPWFQAALEVDRDSVPALLEFGATLGDLGRNEGMLWATRRVLALDPGNSRAFYLQAAMAARAGRDQLALSLLRRAGGDFVGQPAALLLRGVVELRSGNPVLAGELLGRLLSLQPNNVRARTLLARARYDADDFDGAAETLSPLVARADADGYALNLAARIAEARASRGGVAALLFRAARPSPDLPAPFAEIGGEGPAAAEVAGVAAMLRDGNPGGAGMLASRVAGDNPGAPAAQVLAGDALAGAGRWADAARAYGRAANIRFSGEVAMRLIAATRNAGDVPGAIGQLNRFLAQNPANIEANRLAGTLLLGAGDWDAAIGRLEWLRGAVGNDDALLMTDLAWAWLGKGDGDKALAYAAYAHRLAPMSPAAADIYGWALFRANGAGQDSVDLLRKAMAMAPDHPLPKLHLGVAYAAMGRKGEARQLLAAAAGTDFPGRAEAAQALARL